MLHQVRLTLCVFRDMEGHEVGVLDVALPAVRPRDSGDHGEARALERIAGHPKHSLGDRDHLPEVVELLFRDVF